MRERLSFLCSGLTSCLSLNLRLANFNTFFKQVFNIVR
ncbi:hypothetical protein [Vibrio cholerae]|nr:hypothetical protein [Vibrio cholerae]